MYYRLHNFVILFSKYIFKLLLFYIIVPGPSGYSYNKAELAVTDFE